MSTPRPQLNGREAKAERYYETKAEAMLRAKIYRRHGYTVKVIKEGDEYTVLWN